jgi:hypothetical protein
MAWAPDDWYESKNGDYQWFNTSEEINGYRHVGKSTTINSNVYDRGKLEKTLQAYDLNDDGSVTSNGIKYGNGESLTTVGGTTITTGVGTFETSYLSVEGSAVVTAGTGFSHSNLGQGGLALNGSSVVLAGAKFSKSLINRTPLEKEYTLLGQNTETGVKTTSLASMEASFKLHGFGFERLQETLPTGQVNIITKKSLQLYGITFERTSNSNGSWSNEFKFSTSFYRSLFLGGKIEASLSLLKESYKPNK